MDKTLNTNKEDNIKLRPLSLLGVVLQQTKHLCWAKKFVVEDPSISHFPHMPSCVHQRLCKGSRLLEGLLFQLIAPPAVHALLSFPTSAVTS